MTLSRRDFLSTSALATTIGLTRGAKRAMAASSDTRDIRVAQIGTRGQGFGHMRTIRKNLVALCDVDERVLAERAAWCEDEKNLGRKVDTYTDYRRLLERDDIDAVSIATPNHTHALIAIAAIQAGKDVYVEKPVSHNVWEGRQIVNAARRHGRVVQTGTQSRSSQSLKDAVALVQKGELGKIEYAFGTCYKARPSIGKLTTPLDIPATIHYDLWCGPAELRDLYRPALHYDWHWDFNTGCGDLGNQGIHQMDIARWFLGESKLAPRTMSIGGRLGYDDGGDTPNSQIVYHDYPDAPLIFETRGLPKAKKFQKMRDNGRFAWGNDVMNRFRGSRVGVVVQCENGHVLIPDYNTAHVFDREGNRLQSFHSSGNIHHANWLKAVAAGNPADLNADILEGHLSSALCHTGNISHRLGEVTRSAAIAEQIAADPLLSATYDRLTSHLRANQVDVDKEEGALVLGPTLEMNPDTETFTNNDDANQLLKREYRKPFVVPEIG